MLQTVNLTKIYSNGVCALNSINISVPSRGCVCIIGPNAAGKTTLLKILSTQLLPTKGEAYVLGFNVVKEYKEIRKRISVVAQEAQPDPYMTPAEHVYWYLIARGASMTDAKQMTASTLKNLGLSDARDQQCGSLSGGQKRRTLIAMALATASDLLILDEPTAGLDPLGKRSIWSYLRNIVKSGTNMIITTHHMEEVEVIGDTVIFLNKGRVISVGSPMDFKRIVKYKFKILFNQTPLLTETMLSNYKRVNLGDKMIIYLTDNSELEQMSNKLAKIGVKFSVHPVGIEDAFIELVGDSYEEAY